MSPPSILVMNLLLSFYCTFSPGSHLSYLTHARVNKSCCKALLLLLFSPLPTRSLQDVSICYSQFQLFKDGRFFSIEDRLHISSRSYDLVDKAWISNPGTSVDMQQLSSTIRAKLPRLFFLWKSDPFFCTGQNFKAPIKTFLRFPNESTHFDYYTILSFVNEKYRRSWGSSDIVLLSVVM